MVEDMTAVRMAENQSRFREANEKIEQAADSMQLLGPVPLLCECPRPECTSLIRLTSDEYEEIRRHPRRFLCVPGHEAIAVSAEAAVVVGGADDRHVIVEKIGEAGEIAEEHYDELSD